MTETTSVVAPPRAGRRPFKALLSAAFVALFVGLAVATLFRYPDARGVARASTDAWLQFKAASTGTQESNAQQLRVMSFNIRLDGEEHDLRHHWRQRRARVVDLLDTYTPWSVGLQEPFSGQLHHLLLKLPARWMTVGHRQDAAAPLDLGHPTRKWDHQTGILYDSEKLRLLHSHHHWLSPTPHVEGSKSWSSMGARTVTVAHFSVLVQPALELLHVNTHLDVGSEEARREQAALLLRVIRQYQQQYPRAALVLTGDFNAAVGQQAYRVLTGGQGDRLLDAWTACSTRNSSSTGASSRSGGCALGPAVSPSFHGWLGLHANTYGARVLQAALFTLHGMGLRMPTAVPSSLRGVARVALDLLASGWRYPIAEAVPQWPFDRMHVDWILYQPQAEAAGSFGQPGGVVLQPRFVSLVDVRPNELYSSDHYPVLAAFDLTEE